MKIFESPKAWTKIGQARRLHQVDLQDQLGRCTMEVNRLKGIVSGLQAGLEANINIAVRGGSHGVPHDKTDELMIVERRLAPFEAKKAALESEIESLGQLSPTEAEERETNQSLVAQLADKRAQHDGLIDIAVQHLRTLLEARAELTSSIASAARAVDFRWEYDGIDDARFLSLLDSLPSSPLADASQQWADWLTGDQGGESYTVQDKLLVRPETLAHNGVFKQGEHVRLTPMQAAELLARTNQRTRPGGPFVEPPVVKDAANEAPSAA